MPESAPGSVGMDSEADSARTVADSEPLEEVDSVGAPVPKQLRVTLSAEGLLLKVRVPLWLRLSRWLAVVSALGLLVAWLPVLELWGAYIEAPAFLVLFAMAAVRVATLHTSRLQYVRDETLRWGSDTVTCVRLRDSWRAPLSEIDGVDVMELGEKRSLLPSHAAPTWLEYQVNVTVKDTVKECFRSSDRRLVEWVACTLQTELKGALAADK
jgi:hypothetical protein